MATPHTSARIIPRARLMTTVRFLWDHTSLGEPLARIPTAYISSRLDNNQYGANGRFLTHSCAFPFGPAQGKKPCSKGCIVSSPDNIRALNGLLNAEPGSTLNVVP